ncbi:AfsR/SARP family transcriptional regulator [Pseudonocardia nigra]|uniref:AfsR/SARP family transcriptional regulator n=1 Tax=Pseudonocardia nigra TaxID=1921578 RepID=UPI001C5D4780|nr:bacterial transcriptional activator domain-containing protein [Pseudonocardia nigra]
MPDDHSGRMEWVAEQSDPLVDPAFLDIALRGLTLSDWSGLEPPTLRFVVLGADQATLTLSTRASLPPPFEAIGDADHWLLDATAELPLAADEAGGFCAPYPTLVSIATSVDGQALLVDLEELGVAHVTGELARATGLLRHVAAELANARWGEDIEVLLAGFGSELVPLNPERLTVVPDLAAGLVAARARIRDARESMDQHGLGSVMEGRLRPVAPDAWVPIIVLAAGAATEADRAAAEELAPMIDDAGRWPVALITAGITRAGQEIHIADDGMLLLSGAGEGWTAEQMSASAGSDLAAILAPTLEPDLPARPATEPEPWASGMTEDGSLDAPQPDADPDPRPRPLAAPSQADPEAVRRLAIADHQDPDLDADLTCWRADGCPPVPLIGILGEPVVRAPGDLPSRRTSWFTEVLVYLALHPLGVTVQTGLTDLWPDGQKVTTATVRHAFYGARRWAGRGLGGDPERAFVSELQGDGTYRIRGHLLDWDLFRRLRKRAQARDAAGHPGAVGDYEAALGLIRGPVLHPLRPGGYAWLNNHDQRHDLQIPGFLVDAAHELVDLALADGDTARAREAAEFARVIDIDTVFDRPLTDLMRVAHAEDQHSEMERYAAILLDARGFEVPEELPPETFAVLNELLPNGPRRP